MCCVCVCVYRCICVYTSVTGACVCTCVYRCMCIHVYMSVHACTGACVCTCVCMCVQIHMFVHVCTGAYMWGCAWRLEADINNHPQLLFCLIHRGRSLREFADMSPLASHFALGIPCFHRVWNYRRAARPTQHIPEFHRSKHWSLGSYSTYFSAELSFRPRLTITWLQKLSRAKTPPNSRLHFHLPQEPTENSPRHISWAIKKISII